MTTKSFVAILLLTFLLGFVTGFFIHKDYFDKPEVSVIEKQLNEKEILRMDSIRKNTSLIRAALDSAKKELNDLDKE